MNSTVEPLEGNRVKLTVTVPAETVDKAIEQAYSSVASEVRVPGFRQGRAPRPVVDTYVGRERVLAKAQENIVEETYLRAIDSNGVRPIDQPDMGELPGLAEHSEYVYVAEVEVRPELTLTGDWRKIEISLPPGEATDQDVQEQIDTLREKFASLEPVEDRGVAAGDFVLISFVGLVDGEVYEGNVVDKYLYELGRGQMPPEFDEAIIGAKPGDTVQSSFTIPETTGNPEFTGKTATFDITVHEIKAKLLPEPDDEFAANAGGFDTIAEVRADIRDRLDKQRALTRSQETERRASAALAEMLVGDVPESMVMHRRDNMLRDFFGNLEARGISLKDYVKATNVDPEQIQADIQEEAALRVRQDLAMEALFRAEGMEITDADIDEEIAGIASATDKSPEELRRQWEEAGVLAVLNESVMHRKAIQRLLYVVKTTEESDSAEKPAAEKAAKPKRPRKSAKKEE